MSEALRQRGSGSSGAWVDETVGFALGQHRLALVDGVGEGHEPTISLSGRYVLSLSGSLYNARILEQELARLDALSTAEPGRDGMHIALDAFERWGVADALNRFNGIFAFALWDRAERVLYLGRDRLGQKPLYYGKMGGTFVFASDLKALRAHPSWQGEIDRQALTLYLRYHYIPTPYSIYQGIRKLPPGCYLIVRGGDGECSACAPVPYWSVRQVAEHGASHPVLDSGAAAVAQADAILRAAVGSCMDADRPVGALLSGGIDSSTVAALAQSLSHRRVQTFSVGFHEQGYDEAPHAKAVAQHIGAEHTEFYVTSEQTLAVVPRLASLYNEPLGDQASIPTLLVCELARQSVSTVLTGTGGDELFGGHGHYFSLAERYWHRIGWLPANLRQHAAAALTSLAASLGTTLSSGARRQLRHQRIRKLAEVLASPSPEAMYLSFISHWNRPSTIVLGGIEPAALSSDWKPGGAVAGVRRRLIYFDIMNILPDDLLVILERASKGSGVEARSPLLDHRVVEFAWRLPMAMKLKAKQNKWLLRQVLDRYVPQHLIERPKSGLGVPLDSWLRGPLRDWAESLLDEQRLRREGYFNPIPIRRVWSEHLAGAHDLQSYVWDILMFQAWREVH